MDDAQRRAEALFMDERFMEYARHIDAPAMEGMVADAIRAAVRASEIAATQSLGRNIIAMMDEGIIAKPSPALAWSKEPPTLAGWYWHRRGDDFVPQCVRVRSEDGQPFLPLFAHFAGSGVLTPLEQVGGEWCGPLEEPKA
jgi:hypothetical protein